MSFRRYLSSKGRDVAIFLFGAMVACALGIIAYLTDSIHQALALGTSEIETRAFWLQAGETFLFLIYVLITHRTFVSINTQTRLQMRAVPYVNCKIETDLAEDVSAPPAKADELNEKWKSRLVKLNSTLVARHEAIAKRHRYLVLVLHNWGINCALSSWKFTIAAEVRPGSISNLVTGSSDSEDWTCGSSDEDGKLVEPGKQIAIAIANIEYFPESTFSWTLTCTDVYGATYKTCGGLTRMSHDNFILKASVSSPATP